MKKFLPALVCGFGAGVLNTVPLIKNFSCCLIVPVAAYLALILDQRANGETDTIRPGKAVQLGLLTGLCAAIFTTLFEVLIVFITRNSELAAGLPAIEQALSQVTSSEISRDMLNIMYKMNDDIVQYGFSALYTFSVLMSGLFVNTIMGIVGGLIGMQILNSRKKEL